VVVVDLVAAAALAAVCAALAIAVPVSEVDPIAVALGVVLYATAWQVTFSVGAGSSTPLQLVFVPMWFVVPPALLPVVAVAGQVLAWLVRDRLAKSGRSPWASVVGVVDAWHAVGPAVVIAAAGWPAPTMAMGQWLLVALGVVSQLGVHSVVARLRRWAKCEPQRALAPWRVTVSSAAVDLALAPLGLILAVELHEARWTVLLVVPFMALLAHFSRERDQRIDEARRLSDAYRGTAQLMGDVLEADDAYTGGEHTQGVVEMALGVGEVLGFDAISMRNLELGALLHDIGKLRVPNAIIHKPGPPTAEEWAIIMEHPALGEAMLRRVGGVLAEAAPIVRGHHERFDGGGYPDGLAGAAIPVEARVITVCDSFSAMTTDRSYRKAMSHHEAIAELRRCTPQQFDPQVVEALIASLDERGPDGLRFAAPAHPAYGEANIGATDQVAEPRAA
jgi:hypothetical protein